MLTILYAPHALTRRERVRQLLTTYAEEGKRVIYFVPEQQVLEAEGFLCAIDGKNRMEATSFKRIANSIFRKFGGLRYHYIGKGAKYVVMWRALTTVSSALKAFGDISFDDLAMIRLFVSTVEEMKLYGITPDALEMAAEKVGEEKLKNKLLDLSLLYAAYDSILHEKHDDASDDLHRAAAIADGKGFFADTHVIIDSFDGFTHEEGELLRLMLKEAPSVTVTLGYEKGTRRKIFAKLKDTDRFLRTLASANSLEVEEESVESRYSDRELGYFAKELWQDKRQKGETVAFSEKASRDKGIRLLACPGIYEEASFVASDIARRVMAGARYRDFAVVTRSTDRYLGILDAALEGAGIPYFLSARKDAVSMPLVRSLFAAFDIFTYRFRTDDVIAYMRCGLSGLTQEECDLLEEYATVWRISGKRWYDEYGWQMNPSGFSLDYTDKDREKLAQLNELRQRLVSPLISLFEAFDEKATVRSVSIALVGYLNATGVASLMQKSSEVADSLSEGRVEREEFNLLYDCLMNSLDQLVEVAGDMAVTCREYSRLLYALLSEATIGKLPARCDEVMIGSANLLRKSGIRHVYVIGLCQGEFPAAESDSSCFDREEKEELLSVGLETSPTGERHIADEKLYFYRAVTGAEASATLSYSYLNADGKEVYPSLAFGDTLALLKDRKVELYDELPEEEKLFGHGDIMEYALRHGYRLQAKNAPMTGDFALVQPLSAAEEAIPEEEAKALYGKKIVLSQSKINKFLKCPFSYHCSYSLKLSQGVSGNFESVDIGNYIHKILEVFFSRVNDRLKEISDGEAKQILNEAIDEYVASVRRGNDTKRFEALVHRLRRTTHLLMMNLLEEFRSSDFVPAFFELPITLDGKEGIVAEEIKVTDSLSVSVVGQVDRVDVYRKGDDTYLRVVDYKTGSKEFSIYDVMDGLGIQLLVYLFTLAFGRKKEFAEKLGCSGEVIPAGALYFSLTSKTAHSGKRPETAEEALTLMEEKISRSGFALHNEALLHAMENRLEGRFLPLVIDKNGKLKPKSSLYLVSTSEIGVLYQSVNNVITSMAKALSVGKAQAKPNRETVETARNSPCRYCKMKPICRVVEEDVPHRPKKRLSPFEATPKEQNDVTGGEN